MANPFGVCNVSILKIASGSNFPFGAITDVSVNVEESCVSFVYTTEEKLIEVKEKLKALGYPEDGEANSLGSKAKSYVSCAIGKMS